MSWYEALVDRKILMRRITAPQLLDEDVIAPRVSTVHADHDAVLDQSNAAL